MARRSPETLVDWLVVGIAPFLIMLLVGSLVFYLVEVFYQGDYQLRLLWVLGLFVMAIVCIARISMEEGTAYASLYAIPLAGAVALALATFVQVRGPLEPVGPVLNWLLMGLVWWSAHKLTWDCTLIEGGKDFTGQGLMQTTGLDRFLRWKMPALNANSNEASAAVFAPAQPDLQGTTELTAQNKGTLPVWQWWTYRDGRPHAPGVWVIYFSIAAIPLFGLGQWFVPAGDLDTRRREFWLLVVYVAAGLALLLSTSFLSLRRYLRQRKLEMPLEMAGVWLGTGGVMIVGLLLLASFLPRPNPEYSVTHLAPEIRSPDLSPSKWGWGREGTKQKDGVQPTATEGKGGEQGSGLKEKNGQQSGGRQSGGQQSGGQQSGGQQSGGQQSGGQQSGGQQSGGQQSGGQQSGGQQSGGQQSGGQQSKSDPGDQRNQQSGNSENQQPPGQSDRSGSQGSPSDQSPNEQPAENPAKQDPSSRPSPDKTQSDQPPPQSAPEQPNHSPSPPPSSSPSWSISDALGQFFAYLMHGLKWLFYLLVIGVIAYFAWKHREQVIAAWQQLLKELRELWAKWFGGKPAMAATAAQSAPPPPSRKRFGDFADPFASGLAARWPLAELVRYTFAAFEARGRDHDCPRGDGQTPLEYAAVVGQLEPALAGEFRSLADLYCQIAFAGGQAPPQSIDLLKQLWQRWR